MRSYTIVKTFALAFGAVSIVARGLPERRSEINAHIARGYGPSNPRRSNLEDASAEVDTAMSRVATVIADVTAGGTLDISMPSY